MSAVSDTFHYPCHVCGQTVEVVGGVRQDHAHVVHESYAAALCAAYWAGYERAGGAS